MKRIRPAIYSIAANSRTGGSCAPSALQEGMPSVAELMCRAYIPEKQKE
jgi:hypothetical protein